MNPARDREKTKEELIVEVEELRNRVAALQEVDRSQLYDKQLLAPRTLVKYTHTNKNTVTNRTTNFSFGVTDGSPAVISSARLEMQDGVCCAINLNEYQQIEGSRKAIDPWQLVTLAGNGTIYDWDVASNRVERSDTMFEFLGYSPQEVEPTSDWWNDRINPDDRPLVWAKICEALGNQTKFQLVYRILNKNNQYIYVSDQGLILRNQDGYPERVIGFTHFITESQPTQSAQKMSEDRFRMALATYPIILFNQDRELRYTWIYNPTLGYSIEEILGKTDAELMFSSDALRVMEIKRRVLTSGVGVKEEVQVNVNGEKVYLDLRVEALRDSDDHIIGITGVAIDISDRKQIETTLKQKVEELENLNQIKDRFLEMVSHHLRTPLNVVLGCAGLLRRTSKFEEGTLKRLLETIERNAKYQLQVSDRILDISRMMESNFQLNLRPLDPVLVIYGATDLVRPLAQAKNITLVSAIECTETEIMGDHDRLQQVLWSLLSNAVKFTPSGGRVEVRLSIEKSIKDEQKRDQNQEEAQKLTNFSSSVSHLQIQVKDTGIGITPHFLPHLFEPFCQGDRNSAQSDGELGLGLTLARYLVELHEGTIDGESAGVGMGATFTIKLPLLIS